MENRSEILGRILRFAKPYRWYLVAALLSAVLSVSLGLYAPVLIGRGIDQILAPGQVYFDRLLPILIELIVVAILAALFQSDDAVHQPCHLQDGAGPADLGL